MQQMLKKKKKTKQVEEVPTLNRMVMIGLSENDN